MNNKNSNKEDYKEIKNIRRFLEVIAIGGLGICFGTLFIGFLALVFAQENVFNNQGELFAEAFICSFIIGIIFYPILYYLDMGLPDDHKSYSYSKLRTITVREDKEKWYKAIPIFPIIVFILILIWVGYGLFTNPSLFS